LFTEGAGLGPAGVGDGKGDDDVVGVVVPFPAHAVATLLAPIAAAVNPAARSAPRREIPPSTVIALPFHHHIVTASEALLTPLCREHGIVHDFEIDAIGDADG